MGMFDLGNIDWGQIAGGMATPGVNPLDEIQRRWPKPGMTAETMAPPMADPMQSPLSPELLAKNLAARGVPPPPQDLGAALVGPGGTGLPGDTPYRMPDEGSTEKWRQGVDQDQTVMPGAPTAPVTATGAPNPMATPSGNTEVSAQSKPGEEKKTPTFADTLKGVKMPASPELQRLGTPAAPRPTSQIKGGELMAMLQMLNAGAGANQYQLPSTLGQALLGRK